MAYCSSSDASRSHSTVFGIQNLTYTRRLNARLPRVTGEVSPVFFRYFQESRNQISHAHANIGRAKFVQDNFKKPRELKDNEILSWTRWHTAC